MREAVIVSTARTPIGRAYRGAFNNTEGPTLGGQDSISLVQNEHMNMHRMVDPKLVALHEHI